MADAHPDPVANPDVSAQLRGKEERILDAALALFAQRGYQATAVPEIAKAAGVATGTIYRYFDTKDALLNALYQHWRDDLNAYVLVPLTGGVPTRQAFGVLWQRLADWLTGHPMQAVFLEQHYHKPVLDEKSREADHVLVSAIEQLVVEGVASGDVRDMPPHLAVALIWGAALGLLKMSGDGYLTADAALAAQAETSLWDAIRA